MAQVQHQLFVPPNETPREQNTCIQHQPAWVPISQRLPPRPSSLLPWLPQTCWSRDTAGFDLALSSAMVVPIGDEWMSLEMDGQSLSRKMGGCAE